MAKDKKEKGLSTQVDEEMLAELKASYPTEATFQRVLLPRFGMVSQDITEEVKNPTTKKKEIKIISEAGIFFTEEQTDEVNDEGKKIWKKEEIGDTAEAIILFERKQLRFFDSGDQTYTSSPVYDADDQVVPLFKGKEQVDRGTSTELRSREEYQGTTAKGKATSKLEVNKILYVWYEGKIFQMNLRGSSMYSFIKYRKEVTPSVVLTRMGSEAKEAGAINWNQMTFKMVRPLTTEELKTVVGHVREIQASIESERAFYASRSEDAGPKKDQKSLGKGNKDDEEDDF